MFRATSCSSSGESIVSIRHLVYVTLFRWPFRVKVSDLHTKRSPTQSDIYQMSYWYNWFSWWWARGCSKHVENWNKYIEKNCASSLSFTNIHWTFDHLRWDRYAVSKVWMPGNISNKFICTYHWHKHHLPTANLSDFHRNTCTVKGTVTPKQAYVSLRGPGG
jgi:hypothetical protein